MASVLTDLKELSVTLGLNPSLVQAEGGNTSCKVDGQLLVKASGKRLQRALDENIFVSVDLNQAQEVVNRALSEVSAEIPALTRDGLRPSIETPLHVLLPHTFVAHVHALNTVCVSVQPHFDGELSTIAEANDWRILEYEKPGIELARAVNREVASFPLVLYFFCGITAFSWVVSQSKKLLT